MYIDVGVLCVLIGIVTFIIGIVVGIVSTLVAIGKQEQIDKMYERLRGDKYDE